MDDLIKNLRQDCIRLENDAAELKADRDSLREQLAKAKAELAEEEANFETVESELLRISSENQNFARQVAKAQAELQSYETICLLFEDDARKIKADRDRLVEALEFYEGKGGIKAGHIEWNPHVCDKYSGLGYAPDWDGNVQDEPWEVASRALASRMPKPSKPEEI